MHLHDLLFETEALKVSPYDRPFFYTSGKLGPFYVNTHYLFGSSADASGLLSSIDRLLISDRKRIPEDIYLKTKKQYHISAIYKETTDRLVSEIVKKYGNPDHMYISGGERRDWFFSYMAAKLLDLKHITIFKDRSFILSCKDHIFENSYIKKDAVIIHVCDLVTEASSFENYWIPAMSAANALFSSVYSVVDRNQGGTGYFSDKDISFRSVITIDKPFFDLALSKKYISDKQYAMIIEYINDPDACMRRFLINNADFLKQVIGSQTKDSDKARILIENNLYDLPDEYIGGFYV